MPELALARTDHDFTVSGRPETAAKRAGRALAVERAPGNSRNAAPKPKPRLLPYAKYLTGGNLLRAGLAAATLGFLVNALALQKARHPAPLFVSAGPAMAAPGGNSAALAPAVPLPRPPDLVAATPAAPARMVGAARPAAGHPPAVASDPIAMLLRPHVAKPDPAKPDAAKPEPVKSVMAAQKALLKLGFVLKPDGMFGGTTRQAIERFERDQGMPVKGDLTPRIMRMLAAESGVANN